MLPPATITAATCQYAVTAFQCLNWRPVCVNQNHVLQCTRLIRFIHFSEVRILMVLCTVIHCHYLKDHLSGKSGNGNDLPKKSRNCWGKACQGKLLLLTSSSGLSVFASLVMPFQNFFAVTCVMRDLIFSWNAAHCLSFVLNGFLQDSHHWCRCLLA